jgi:hypothetical protein
VDDASSLRMIRVISVRWLDGSACRLGGEDSPTRGRTGFARPRLHEFLKQRQPVGVTDVFQDLPPERAVANRVSRAFRSRYNSSPVSRANCARKLLHRRRYIRR